MDDLGLMFHVMQNVITRIKVGSSEEKPICVISKGMVLLVWWEFHFGYAMNLMKVCCDRT
jgi:zinc transporter ZupT